MDGLIFRWIEVERMDNMFVNSRLESLVQPDIELGERLVWAGQPSPWRMVLQSLPLFGFGVVWSAFTASFIVGWYGVPERDVSGPWGLWGFHGIAAALFFVPFALIGVGMLLSPLWAFISAKRTVYAMTEKRIVILEWMRSRSVRSYTKAEIGDIEMLERPDGTGDLTFAQKPYRDSEGDPQVKDVKFVGIPEVREVEHLLRETFSIGV